MVAGVLGSMSGSTARLGPLRVKLTGARDRLAIVKLTRPAPNRSGETSTCSGSILAVTSIGAGGRFLFSQSSSPHAANETAIATTTAPSAARRPAPRALPKTPLLMQLQT